MFWAFEIVFLNAETWQTSRKGLVKKFSVTFMAPGVEIEVWRCMRLRIPNEMPAAVWEGKPRASLQKYQKKQSTNRVDPSRDTFCDDRWRRRARTLDDAVYCGKPAGGWKFIFVAIADVSIMWKKDSALDEEAIVRGNSVTSR